MRMQTMEVPATRAEFEHRIHLLLERIRQKRYHIPGGQAHNELAKIRQLPNGRIDFLSIDELVRLQANTMFQFDSEEFKDIIDNHRDQ